MPVQLRSWILASILAAILATNLGWLIVRHLPGRSALSRAITWPGTGAITWFVVGLYLLIPPVAAWRQGLLSPYFTGLSENDWLLALGAGGGLVVLVCSLALGGWLVYRRTLRATPLGSAEAGGPSGAERMVAPVSAALWGWHWSFYRAGAIAWLASGVAVPAPLLGAVPMAAQWLQGVATAWHAQPVYWGSWLGLLLVALEWILNPFARANLRTPGRLEGAVRLVGLAIATTGLFALTRNLWLCLLCNVVVETVAAAWFPVPALEA